MDRTVVDCVIIALSVNVAISHGGDPTPEKRRELFFQNRVQRLDNDISPVGKSESP